MEDPSHCVHPDLSARRVNDPDRWLVLDVAPHELDFPRPFAPRVVVDAEQEQLVPSPVVDPYRVLRGVDETSKGK